jgi:hypothetical protein
MKLIIPLLTILILISALNNRTIAQTESEKISGKTIFLNFDDIKINNLPSGWKTEATNKKNVAAVWRVTKDKTAPSGNQTISITDINNSHGGTFNLCWTDNISFLNGTIEVKFKALTGHEDQGGGIMWRVQDKNNYYVARFNPLEDNLRIYTVKNSIRKMIGNANIKLPAGQWHTLKITQNETLIEGYINNKKIAEIRNNLLPESGGIGLWTKADAVTTFDNLSIKPKKK